MSTAQDSATTANAPTTSSPQTNPTDKMSQCEKVDVIDTPTSSLAPVTQSQTQSTVSVSSGTVAATPASPLLSRTPSQAVSPLIEPAAVPTALKKSSSHFNTIPKPPSAPQSPGRSAVTKSKSTSRPKRHRCRSCRGVANPMMGTCPDCDLIFCNSHRMPEDHHCLQAEARRLALKNEHRETMMRNATRQNKVIQF